MGNCTNRSFCSEDYMLEGDFFRLEPFSTHVNVNLGRYRVNDNRKGDLRRFVNSLIGQGDGGGIRHISGQDQSQILLLMS
jgi:hypothetical protein